MSYSVHRLNIENHFHIIGRQDGVTGDSIKANDEIVFCASCQSVFLKESWEYMKENHCNQSETLDFVPSPVPKLIIRKGNKLNDKLIYDFKDEFRYEVYRILDIVSALKTRFFPVLVALGGILLIWHLVPDEYFFGQKSVFSVFFSVVILIFGNIIGIMMNNNTTKKITEEFSKLKILETGIITEEKFYYYNQLQSINSYKKKDKHYLVIKLKNNQTLTKHLSVRDYERTKPFYLALAWAAQFVEINFDTKDQKEYGLLKSIERNYAGRIFVEDHSIIS